MKLPYKKYDLIYADPPWPYYGDPNKNAAAGKHYRLMTVDEICQFRVRELMKDKAGLLIWVTSSKMDLAIDVIRSWNLYYRGVAYVWVKTTKDGKVIHGQGINPTYTKPTTEYVLLGTTVRVGRPFPIYDLGQGQVVFAPRGVHSEKPEEVRRRIERNTGNISKIELFARKISPAWDAYGDEIGLIINSSS